MLNIQFIRVPFVSSYSIDDYVEALSFGISPSGEYVQELYATDVFSGYLTGFNSFFSGSGYWLTSGNSAALSRFLFDQISGYSTGQIRYTSLDSNWLLQGFVSQSGTTSGNLYLIQNYQQDRFANYPTGQYNGSFLNSGISLNQYSEATGVTTGNTFSYVANYSNSGSLTQSWSVTYSPAINSTTEPFLGAKSYQANNTGYANTPYSNSFLLGNYTAEMWFNMGETSPLTYYPYLFGNDYNYTPMSGFSVQIIPKNGGVDSRVYYRNRTAGLEYTGIASGTWAHVAVSRYTGDPTNVSDSGSLNIFYNGNKVASTSYVSAPVLTGRLLSTFPMALGVPAGFPSYSDAFFTGYWSEFRLWNYSRSASEIQSTMSTKINPSAQTGLLLYLSL